MAPPVDIKQLEALVEPVVAGLGYELVELEWKHEAGHWVLRLFIDRAAGAKVTTVSEQMSEVAVASPGTSPSDEVKGVMGISVEDCSRVSHAISAELDVADILHVPYHLEVSSPGLDRPLRREQDFARYVGKQVKVKTRHPIGENRRNFKGQILGAAGGRLKLDVDGIAYEIPVDDVEKANLVPDFLVGN